MTHKEFNEKKKLHGFKDQETDIFEDSNISIN